MSLHTIAPRLARARDQMNEAERVLGWMRDKSWTGGFYVLVPVTHWLPERGREWVRVDRVTAGATPYPIKGTIEDPTRRLMRGGDGRITPSDMGNVKVPGQWGFWEVAGIRFLTDDYPELFEMHADSTTGPLPHPPVHQPCGKTDPPCSEDKTKDEIVMSVDWGSDAPPIPYFIKREFIKWDEIGPSALPAPKYWWPHKP